MLRDPEHLASSELPSNAVAQESRRVLKVDLAEARRFLARLDPAAKEFRLRTFADAKAGGGARKYSGDLDSRSSDLVTDNLEARGIFVVVNEGGDTDEHITRVRAVFADTDGAPLQPILDGPLRPHLIVETSPGKWHAYWLVDGMSLEDFRGVQRQIALRFGTDRSVINLSRVMRIPGFYHQKHGPHLVRLVDDLDAPPYTVDQVLAAFPPIQAFPKVHRKVSARATGAAEDRQALDGIRAGWAAIALTAAAAAVAGAAGGERNNTLNREAFRVANYLELSDDEIINTLTPAATEAGLAPNEIDGTLRSAIASGRKTPRPPPDLSVPRFEFREGPGMRHPGVYYIGLKTNGDSLPPLWICGPLKIAASTRSAEGSDWGRLLEWSDRDGRTHRWAMPMSMLADSGESLRSALLAGGLDINPNPRSRMLIAEYIAKEEPAVRVRAVARTGWSGKMFALPDRTIGQDGGELIHYQAASTETAKVSQAGSLSGWRQSVSIPLIGNSRLVFAVSAAFAAPSLGMLMEEGGGYHFRGPSSSGKTTTLAVAASVWGGNDYIRSWRATDNALESVATRHNDLLLCLDEIAQLAPKVAGATSYMLANGHGKSRARTDGSARPPAQWRALFLSTGEIRLADLISEAGGRSQAGQEVRVIDIPADAGAGLGIFEVVPWEASGPGAFADLLRAAAVKDHGHAGIEFVARAAAAFDASVEVLTQTRDRIASEMTDGKDAGQVQRVARRFALVAAAGELATEWGITGWPAGEATRAAKTCFADWIKARGTRASSEPAAMLAQVRGFLERHGSSRFTPWVNGSNHATVNRAGFRRGPEMEPAAGFQVVDPWDDNAPVAPAHQTIDATTEFYILPGVFKTEVCVGFDSQAVARVLLDVGALKPSTDDSFTRRERLPEIGLTRVYRITSAIWEAEA